jgi:hypothetical protein
VILGHSLKEMDAYYLKPTDEDLTKAIKRYTLWLDRQQVGIKEKGVLES